MAGNNTKPPMPVINADFDQELVRKRFVSYFKDKKLGETFDKKLTSLSTQNQSYCLSLFNDAAQELGPEASLRNKHFLALRIYDALEVIDRKNGGATGMVEMFLDKFPQFKKHQVGINLYQLAEAADWTSGVNTDFTPEQKAELTKLKKETAELKKETAELKKETAELEKKIASDRRVIDKIDKLRGIGNSITEELKKPNSHSIER
ncbi:MAG: hypothetical protein GY770_21135 [Aestuariibacter sp.]|nr:hypothetical protein [Aestuariibacter sp.]MCP4236051.1 hypothetical protein [Aestuariibacter sp.]